MDYRPAFPSQMGIKGRLWLTNVFQDGSHETHLVFKAVVVKECLNSGDFLTYFPPPLGLGKRSNSPTSVHSIGDTQPLLSHQPQTPGWGLPPFLHYIRSVVPPSFLSVYLMSF